MKYEQEGALGVRHGAGVSVTMLPFYTGKVGIRGPL